MLNFRYKPGKMINKIPKQPQLEMYQTVLVNFINLNHELCQLANKIDWDGLEADLASYYSEIGRPAVPVRTMVGMLLLKQIYNLSDESVVTRWMENPYWQHFTGEVYFQYKPPFNPTDFVHFRKRMGEKGMERILKESIHLFSEAEIRQAVKEVRIDTTVQEKNITFPTDRKLYLKVIQYCIRNAEKEGIKLKRTYPREIKRIINALRFSHHPRNIKKKKKLERQLYRIAVKVYNDFLDQVEYKTEAYNEELDLMYAVLTQKKEDSNKVYSLHEPEVHCIAKGKDHKKYEFGNKSGFAYSRYGKIILGAIGFEGNPFDGHTLEPQLEQVKELTGLKPRYAIVDRGYRGKSEIDGIKIVMPKNLKRESRYLKKKREERCRSRSGVEAVISHLKIDHRMLRNYLSGVLGDKVNTLMAAAAYNMKLWMIRQRESIFYFIRFLFLQPPILILGYNKTVGSKENGDL